MPTVTKPGTNYDQFRGSVFGIGPATIQFEIGNSLCIEFEIGTQDGRAKPRLDGERYEIVSDDVVLFGYRVKRNLPNDVNDMWRYSEAPR